MNSVDIIKKVCKEQKIPISRLERDLGYGNGYIGQLRKGTIPSDRAIEIANYLNIDLQYLLTGKEEATKEESELTTRDRRDIAKDLDRIMVEIANEKDGPLFYNGQPLDPDDMIFLSKAIEAALTDAKKRNKVDYNSYKNRPKK